MTDIFIAHATEDKESFVRPFAEELRRQRISVWYDEFSLRVGDSLRREIERGLSAARHGVVVLSANFFAKEWPQRELDALSERGVIGPDKRIIPVWHEITSAEIERYSPTMAAILGISTEIGITGIIDRFFNDIPDLLPPPDLSRTQPTLVTGLDRLLRGGLPRPSSVLIRGPADVGKSLLCTQIQIAALDRSESGLYITYNKTPIDILRRMVGLGANMKCYAEHNNFRVFDAFSAQHGISESDVRRSLSDLHNSLVEYVPNPSDASAYMEQQQDLMRRVGYGGVNVIDSMAERVDLLPNTGGDSVESALHFFDAMKTRISRMGGQTALHVQPTSRPIFRNRKVLALFDQQQNGLIELRFEQQSRRSKRLLRITRLHGSPHDNRWHEFIIKPQGIEVF